MAICKSHRRVFSVCFLLLTAFCVQALGQGGTGKLPPPRMPRNPPVRNPPPGPRSNPFPAAAKQLVGNWVEMGKAMASQFTGVTFIFSSEGSGISIQGSARTNFRYRLEGDMLLTDFGNYRTKFDGDALKLTNVRSGQSAWYAKTNGKREVAIVFRSQLSLQALDPPYEIAGDCVTVTPGSRVEFGAMLVQVDGTVLKKPPKVGAEEPQPVRVKGSWYLSSPVNGTVAKVLVKCGQPIKDNQLLLTIRRD